jgi:hypothetical protein
MTLLFHAGGTPTLPSVAALKGARASCPPEPGPAYAKASAYAKATADKTARQAAQPPYCSGYMGTDKKLIVTGSIGILPVHSRNRQDACSPSFLHADD